MSVDTRIWPARKSRGMSRRNLPALNNWDIRVGDTVQWRSQVGGYGGRMVERVGKVVRIIYFGEDPLAVAAEEFPNHWIQFARGFIPWGHPLAYLVEVIHSDRARLKLYKPNPRRLQVISRA